MPRRTNSLSSASRILIGNSILASLDSRLEGFGRRLILCNGIFRHWNSYRYSSPAAIRLYFHLAFELTQALSNSTNAYTRSSRLNQGQPLWRHARPLIAYFNCDLTGVTGNPDGRRVAARMAVDIRQALLDQAENHKFHVTGQSAEILRHIKPDLQPATLYESLCVPA